MLRKLTLPLLAIASLATAADVTISGDIHADLESNLDASWKANNSANQKVNLTTRAEFDEKAAVELYVTNYSTVTDADGNVRQSVVRSVEPGRSAGIADPASRWGNMVFDGLQFQWEFSRKAKLLVGDLSWSAGSTNYYGYSFSSEYGSIMKSNSVRGLGFDLGGMGYVYLGAPDANNRALWGAAAYTIDIIARTEEKWMIRPVGDLVFKNGGRSARYNIGAISEYSKATGDWNYGLNASIATRPFHDENTYNFLAEPSLGYKAFSLAATYYQAILADADSAASLQTDIPEEQFAYVEPGVSLHPKFSMGLAGEYHNPSVKLQDDEYFAAVPTFYLYPAEQMTLTAWTKYQWMMKAHDLIGFGLSGKVNF